MKKIIHNKSTIFAKFATVLCVFIALTLTLSAASGKTTSSLSFNELELKDGKVLTFSSLSKIGNKALRVVLSNGKAMTVSREALSDAEIKHRFGGTFGITKKFNPYHKYGKAYYVKSKLPKDFDADKFKELMEVRYEQMQHGEYNAVKQAWRRLLEDDNIDSIDELFLPENPVMKYHYFVPDKKNIKKREKVPLVVFLHGMTDQKHMNRHPQCLVFVQPEVQKAHPCYFLAPLTNGAKSEAWYYPGSEDDYIADNLKMVVGIIDSMLKKYPGIDPDRIYVTGLSSGGIATWGLISLFPGKFAGGVPIAAGWGEQLKNMKHKQKVAIWAFCNPGEQKETRFDVVKMLKRVAELGADARYSKFQIENDAVKKRKKTKYKNRHAAQNWAYAEPDLIPWLFSHKRERSKE